MTVEFTGGSKVDGALIAAFEEEFGVTLPKSFVDVVSVHAGATLEPTNFPSLPMPDGSREMLSLAFLFPFERSEYSWSIFEANRSLRNLVHGFVNIGENGGGDETLLDFRVPGMEPPVYVLQHRWGHGRRLVPAADSFPRFLESFVTDEESDRLHKAFTGQV